MGLMKKVAGPVRQTPLSSSTDRSFGSKAAASHHGHSQAMQARRIMQFLRTSDARLSGWPGNAVELTRQMKVLQRAVGQERATAVMTGYLQRQRDMAKAEMLQRQEEIDEDELQMRAAPEALQREELDDEELLQTKATDGPTSQAANNTGMPDQLKAGVEALSGLDMSDVRVHYDSDKPAEVGALAYAQGTDIHLGPGQEKHLPHEAWHVVQQAEGRVRPTMQAYGVAINDDAGLEREADVMGKRAISSLDSRQTLQALSQNLTPLSLYKTAIQLHHNKPLNDETEADASIYIVTTDMKASKASEVDASDVVYVGQTCDGVGIESRFTQHLRNHTKWEKKTHRILLREKMKSCTQLEVTASERYWYDHYKGAGSKLENAIAPLTKAKFNRYKSDKTFRGEAKSFPKNWTPAE
jgi:hypothetical protein